MTRRHRNVDRRAFLSAMGVGAAVLPLLEAERVSAQSGSDGPKRVFILVWTDGMMNAQQDWASEGTNFTLPDFLQPLEPHRDDIILLNGLAYRFIRDSPSISERTGHAAYPGMLTGAIYQSGGSSTAGDVAGGISIDQHIGNALQDQGYQGLTSLNLGVKVDSTARLSWRGAGSNNAIVPNENPYDVFDDLFAGSMGDSGDDGNAEIDRIRAMRASIIDYVAGDLERFSASLGTLDRQRIDAHLTSVRELERQLEVGASGGDPGSVAIPQLAQGIDTASTVNFHTVTEMQMQVATAAFAADITRVTVLQLGDQGGSNIVLTPLGFDASNTQTSGNTGLVEGLHVIAHENGADKRRTDQWFQEQVALLIQMLKDTTDAGGASLFDSTVMLAMTNMRTGMHETDRVPAVLAGSMGGYFATGRSLNLTAPNNGVLIALANAVGVPTETFGDSSYGGELTELRG